jgi:hypothetical protein
VPIGVVYTVIGANMLIGLARRSTRPSTASSSGSVATACRSRFLLVLAGAVIVLCTTYV